MKEIWKDIEGFEGLYQASNHGNIKSLQRNTHNQFGKKDLLMKLTKVPSGYLEISLIKNGIKYNSLVHRIIAQTYISNPQNKKTVNHKDGNKQNNKVNNLEWCTYSENIKHAYNNGLSKARKGENNSLAKLKEKDVIFIRKNKNKYPHKYFAKMFNIHETYVSQIILNKRWQHLKQPDGIC